MNARVSFVLAATLAAAATMPTHARAQAFEGVVTFQMNPARAPQPMSAQYSIKGENRRMDITAMGRQMITLYHGATGTVDMVIPMRKMYIERTVDSMRTALAGGLDSAGAKVKVHWTGKKETIAGYECEHVDITGPGDTTDVCVAKGLGSFVPMEGGMGRRGGRGPGAAATMWETYIGQGFPLKVERGGNVEMLVTSVQKKSLADSLFTVPSGYTKMTMPGRGGGGR